MDNGALLHGNKRILQDVVLVGVDEREHELAFQNFRDQFALFKGRHLIDEHLDALPREGGAA